MRLNRVRRSIVVAVWRSRRTVVMATAVQADDPPRQPQEAIPEKMQRFQSKAAGHEGDAQVLVRPVRRPARPRRQPRRHRPPGPRRLHHLRRAGHAPRRTTCTEPSHQEAHIHHAHWFALDPGNKEDNYTSGNTEWIFGNGDEETKADFSERSAAEPERPDLRPVRRRGRPAADDLHAAQQDEPAAQRLDRRSTSRSSTARRPTLKAKGGRPYHDISGVLFGRTFDVPRQPNGDGMFNDDARTRPSRSSGRRRSTAR